jgi:hypothetical protein
MHVVFKRFIKDALLGLIVTITCILNLCNIENKLVFRTEILNLEHNTCIDSFTGIWW